jgi:type II secretory pathway pseudopilin PulG
MRSTSISNYLKKREHNFNSGFSMLEVMLGAIILVILVVPLISVMQSSTRATALSRDHLIAEHLGRSIYEYVAFWGNTDSTVSFENAETIFEVPETLTCPLNGLKGKSVTELSTEPGDILMPDDGEEQFRLDGTSPDFANLYKRFSYTLDITKSTKDTVVTSTSMAALFRCDIKVYWKDTVGKEKEFKFSNYLAKRKY